MVQEPGRENVGASIYEEIAAWRQRIAQQTGTFGADAEITIPCQVLEHFLELAEAGAGALQAPGAALADDAGPSGLTI